ncbi:MAG: hypothetical protein M0Z40_16140, partial [Actinomycetota bacterium]|nr:hypothetical protein [Actinomycetota bacterium]
MVPGDLAAFDREWREEVSLYELVTRAGLLRRPRFVRRPGAMAWSPTAGAPAAEAGKGRRTETTSDSGARKHNSKVGNSSE